MTLEPNEPIGRPNRKARGHLDDIAKLRRRGYSLEAIRRTLANAGILVSKSTVHREAIKSLARHTTPVQELQLPNRGSTRPQPCEAPTARPGTSDTEDHQLVQRMFDTHSSGKDFAEAFMRNRISNPLLRRNP